jgi:GlcNAc-P-P-Und epimerase
MRSIVLFGGSGFVGTHLVRHLGELFERIYIADIRAPGWRYKKDAPANPGAVFVKCDVRQPIDLSLFEEIDCIVNLAAVHITPGHLPSEYFETNILGANNVCTFAEAKNVTQILFVSSISVYGAGEAEKNEESIPMPSIPYGTSKLVAEYIHREWYLRGVERRLCVVRPAAIFGMGEGGNFTRIANALERGYFAYPGRVDTIKSCIYVKDVCRFLVDRIVNAKGFDLCNLCYQEKNTLKRIVDELTTVLDYKPANAVIPLWLVRAAAAVLSAMRVTSVTSMEPAPERLNKLVTSTNISADKLINAYGFDIRYPLKEAFLDWASDCRGRTLF